MKLSSSPRVQSNAWRTGVLAAVSGLLTLAAEAQTQRANERAPARPYKAAVAATAPATATATATAAAAAAAASAASSTAATAKAAAAAPAKAASAPAAATAGPAAVERADRAEMDRTQIIGNRELPKVLYIVPWKRPISGAMERPVKSIIDEVLAPLDREVLRRQVRYEAQVRTAGEAAMESAASSPTMPSK
jgi:hypothetical protein